MTDTRTARVRDITLLSAGLLLLAYFISRALTVSIIADEAGSWQMFVSKGDIFPAQYDYFAANNHALNTALMMLFEKLFGTSAFVLRLPNVLAGALYVFSTAMMARRFPSALIGILAFVVMNTNPYMIEYFNLARGYGLAAGLMAFAFWQLWKYFDDGAALKNLLAATLAASLAVFANYTYLNLFLPLAAFTGLFILFHRSEKQMDKRTRFVHATIFTAFVVAVLAIVVPIANDIKAGGGFWSAIYKNFWTESVASVVDGVLLGVGPDRQDLVYKCVLLVAEIYFVASLVVLGRAFVTRKESERNYFPLFVFTTLTLAGLSVVVQHHLLGVEYPVQRMGLFMVWPLLLLISLAAGLSKKNYWFTVAPFGMLTALLLWHFVSTASSWRNAFHPASEQVNETIAYMEERTPEGERIRVVLDPILLTNGFDFYMTTGNHARFDVAKDTSFQNPLYRYCFVSSEYVNKVPREQWNFLRGYGNGNALFESTFIDHKPIAVQQVNSATDTVTVLSEWMNHFGAGGRWLDSTHDAAFKLAHVEMELWRAEDAHAKMWVYVFHEGQQVFVSEYNLEHVPAAEEWQKTAFDVVLPKVSYFDDVIAAMFWQSGGATQIKNFTLTVKAY